MVRSYWKRTLVTSLTWAGLAWGQQPAATPAHAPAAAPPQQPPAAPAEQTERTLTVQEIGKSPQKCKILRTWRTSDGATAHQVQAIATGEMITIVETGTATPVANQGSGGRLHAVSTRIY